MVPSFLGHVLCKGGCALRVLVSLRVMSGICLPHQQVWRSFLPCVVLACAVQVHVPVGLADFPLEPQRCPRSVASRRFTDIVQYTEMPRGGHFAAMEEPELLAQDLNGFVATVLARTAEQA